MVAGMTPSTVKAGFVSAVLDAGYHIELAGGGHYNATALRSKVAEIQKHIPAGGIEEHSQFCVVAGNYGESFKVARNDNVQALMDFAIVTCWKVISNPSLFLYLLTYSRRSYSFVLGLTCYYSFYYLFILDVLMSNLP